MFNDHFRVQKTNGRWRRWPQEVEFAGKVIVLFNMEIFNCLFFWLPGWVTTFYPVILQLCLGFKRFSWFLSKKMA